MIVQIESLPVFTEDHFRRGEIFFLHIALAAADHHISTGTAPAARNGDDVIEGQFTFRKLLFAIMADTLRKEILKITAFTQLTGFGAFAFDMRLIAFDLDPVIHGNTLRIPFSPHQGCGESLLSTPAGGAAWAEIRKHPAKADLPPPVRKQNRWKAKLSLWGRSP